MSISLLECPISYDRVGSLLAVTLGREAADHPTLAQEALPEIDADIVGIEVDLGAIDQVNSVLVGWLVRLAAHAHRPVRVVNANVRVRQLLTRMRLDSILAVA